MSKVHREGNGSGLTRKCAYKDMRVGAGGWGKITFFFLPLLFKSQNKTPNMKSIVIVFYSVPSLQSLEVNKRAIGENLSRVKYH